MAFIEARIYVHAFVARLYFYIPVLLIHLERQLKAAGTPHPGAFALSLVSVVSVGLILAEYPSGVLADWAGYSRSLLLAGAFQVVGVGLFLVPASVPSLVVAQVLIGVATAFRSGADTALLYAHLERMGESDRYGAALSRLRFFNTLAIGCAGTLGGFLYERSPSMVFVLSLLAAGVGSLSVLGLDLAARGARRDYTQVWRQSLAAMRASPRVQALILLGGLGNPFFVFAFWITQRYASDLGFSLFNTGLAVAAISYLQAATMPLSAWFARRWQRLHRGTNAIVLGLPVSFAVIAAASNHAPVMGSGLLIAIAGSHVLFKNLINIRLHALSPAHVRASVVSFEAWVGAVGYVLIFPVAAMLFSSLGLGGGFLALALATSVTLWPLLLWGIRLRARTEPLPPA